MSIFDHISVFTINLFDILEFNFSSSSYRITPTDVNSRPAACLTTFLLGGRCVVLEARNPNTTARIASHVLCNHGNEIFMHCLMFTGKTIFDDRPSLSESPSGKVADHRINEFNDLIKSIKFVPSAASVKILETQEKLVDKITNKIERITRKWPIVYDESIVANMNFVNKQNKLFD